MKKLVTAWMTFIIIMIGSLPIYAASISVNDSRITAFKAIFKGENGDYIFDASAILKLTPKEQETFQVVLDDINGKNPNRIGIVMFSAFDSPAPFPHLQLKFWSFDKSPCSYRTGSTWVALDVRNSKGFTFTFYKSTRLTIASFYEIASTSSNVYSFGTPASHFIYNPSKIPLPSDVVQTSNISSVGAYYSVNNRALKIEYLYENGTKAWEPYTETLEKGKAYAVTSPQIAGHVPNISTVSGTMGDVDVTHTVIYSRPKYALTIDYQYENGSQAQKTYNSTYTQGEPFAVRTPAIEGYKASFDDIMGTMEDKDLSYTVIYTKIQEPPPDPPSSSEEEPPGSSTGSQYVIWDPFIVKKGFESISNQMGTAFNAGIGVFLSMMGIFLAVKLIRGLMK